MRRIAVLLISTLSILAAQEGRVSGPVSGILFERNAVRAVLGVAGASHLSPALIRDADYAEASRDGGMVAFSKAGRIAVLSLSDGVERAIAEGSSREMEWNTSNALAFENGGHVFVWRASDNSLSDFGALANVTDLAIDAEGRAVFAAVGGNDAGVYRLQENASPILLATLSGDASLTLDARGSALLVADGRQVLEVATAGGAARIAPDAVEPSGVAASSNGRYLAVADRGSNAVLIYETATKALVRRVEVDFAPSRLEALGKDLFLLNERSSTQALEVLSLQNDANVYFIPAAVEE
ncbi:MAG: hypothetical protein JNL98_24295 [Bryobacterales bacterium]|nr:hypothetical protein [Bryobacterales bacterium]